MPRSSPAGHGGAGVRFADSASSFCGSAACAASAHAQDASATNAIVFLLDMTSSFPSVDSQRRARTFGTATPIMQSRVTIDARRVSSQPSVPAGRIGSTM